MGQSGAKRSAHFYRVLGVAVPLTIIAALLLVACGGSQPKAATTSGSAQRVEVTLSDFTITPSLTTFRAGQRYQFVVTNKGMSQHEFMTMPAGMGTMDMEDMHKIALFHIDAEDLPAGATKSVTYMFRNASPAGQLEFTCYVPGHYQLGMHTPITVG
jgi:uncharacterized cupredoxin-like copper-binding protein